jgi:hypothetical protein
MSAGTRRRRLPAGRARPSPASRWVAGLLNLARTKRTRCPSRRAAPTCGRTRGRQPRGAAGIRSEAARRPPGLPYRRDMPAKKRPGSAGAVTARRLLLDRLARDADIFQLASELAPCTRETTPSRRGVPPRRRGRAGLVRGQPGRPAGPGGTARAVPARARLPPPPERETPVRGAGRSSTARRDRTRDLLDEAARWRTDDLWQYALFAAAAYVRAAASRVGVPVRQACRDLGQRPAHPAP